jgi:hypothetical protein
MRRKQTKRETRARRNRAWREVSEIVGSLDGLPPFFRNGLYSLTRAGLSDLELRLAYERCRAWMARAEKSGAGQCECPCGMQLPVAAVNGQRQSVWHLDHDPRTKTFRGILFERCNREIGDGDRGRKWSHVEYIESHEARLHIEADSVYANEFQQPGAVPD